MANYFVTHVLGIVVMTSSTVVATILGHLDPQKIHQFPFCLLVYYRSLVVANLGILLMAMSFLSKKNYVKAYLDELKNVYF